MTMDFAFAADAQRSIWPRKRCFSRIAAAAVAAASAGVVNAGAATDKRAADAKARVHITPSEPKVDAACRSRCVALGRATRVAPAAAQLLLCSRGSDCDGGSSSDSD